MKDHTDEIARFVGQYDDLDFVPLRIQDAFDRVWWEKIGGKKPAFAKGASLADEGACSTCIPRVQFTLCLFTTALPIDSPSSNDADPLQSLRAYLSSLPTPTAIHTSIQTLIRLLLLYTAAQNGSSHLVLGTSLTSLAVSLISSVAQGAGFNVREETLEEWSPDSIACPSTDVAPDNDVSSKKKGKKSKRTVRIVRPLRDIGMKECAAWAWWSHIPVVGKEKWVWPGAKPGIGTLTKGRLLLQYDMHPMRPY